MHLAYVRHADGNKISGVWRGWGPRATAMQSVSRVLVQEESTALLDSVSIP